MIESIINLATSMKNVALMQQVNLSVMKKAIDMTEVQTAAITEMMSVEMPSDPYIGTNLDIIA